MCWSSGPVVTSSLFLHAGLAVYWITFGLVSPAATIKLGLGCLRPSSWVVTLWACMADFLPGSR